MVPDDSCKWFNFENEFQNLQLIINSFGVFKCEEIIFVGNQDFHAKSWYF